MDERMSRTKEIRVRVRARVRKCGVWGTGQSECESEGDAGWARGVVVMKNAVWA